MRIQKVSFLPFLSATALLLSNSVHIVSASSFLRNISQRQEQNEPGANDKLGGRRLEDSSSEMIQEEISDALPDINFDMRKALEDPIELDLTAAVSLGCGSLALTMDFEKLTGLSTIDVSSITLQEGSDTTTEDCEVLQAWKTAADVVVGFSSNLASGNVRSRVVGTCNGVTYDQPLTSSVIATGAGFTGTANMEGTFGPIANNINRAEILGTLALTTSSIAASVSLFPTALSAYLATATSQLEAAFRTQLVQEIEPLVRKELEKNIPSNLLLSVFDNLIGNALPMLSELLGSFLNGGGD